MKERNAMIHGVKIVKNFETRMVEFWQNGNLIRQREMAKWEVEWKDEVEEPEEKSVINMSQLKERFRSL